MDANKKICLDEVSVRLLRSLKSERQKLGMSQRKLAQTIGCIRSLISSFENGERIPAVGNLVRLAKIFGHDISSSVNYKYYHGLINWQELKERFAYCGFTFRELGSYIAYVSIHGWKSQKVCVFAGSTFAPKSYGQNLTLRYLAAITTCSMSAVHTRS